MAGLETADHSDDPPAEILGRLEAYAGRHFAAEEALMARIGHPDLAAHTDNRLPTERTSSSLCRRICDMVNE